MGITVTDAEEKKVITDNSIKITMDGMMNKLEITLNL